jgi:aminoglycoside phosphotransferase (APT) family kinase protein
MALHDDEITADAALVTRLLADQAPAFAGMPVKQLETNGTDNWMFRLGDTASDGPVVRLPRRPSAAAKIIKECAILPRFVSLPLNTPKPLFQGQPSASFDYPWSVLEWLPGETPSALWLATANGTGTALGQFLRALQAQAPLGGPLSGSANNNRGIALAGLDATVGGTLGRLSEADLGVEAATVLGLWQDATAAPVYADKPKWLHADLHAENVLAEGGQLTAILDFGLAGRGDPACELITGWSDLDATNRAAFFSAVVRDKAMWRRGRGWATYSAVITLAYYQGRHPRLEQRARRSLMAMLNKDVPC